MEIVEKETVEAAPQTTPPGASEDFTKKITEAFAQGELMAKKIHETVIGQWFTMMRLSNLTGKPVREIEKDLRFIAQFFLLEDKVEMGVKTFRIVLDSKERLAFIEDNKNMRFAEIKTWDMIAQLILENIVQA